MNGRSVMQEIEKNAKFTHLEQEVYVLTGATSKAQRQPRHIVNRDSKSCPLFSCSFVVREIFQILL